MLSIFGKNTRSLIDSGATHSFISYAFAINADLMTEPLDSDLVVAIPIGHLLLANKVYKDCVIRVNDHKLRANLIPLDIHDFDVILGMDFLAANHASVDCLHKELKLDDIPVVRDFPDVFPEDLPWLSPDREIKFTIDLIPGTIPISHTP
ncbi:uncharacterized protein LOC111387627 [Olea europaea var. sylvestris]|uniref:uncharacterized protein LOC111387627 n=1 Tax=Olea europaea var. sylvestris TaxID=158386 RepID=UPI000C1CEA1E|nr:uncharacterized protein LOC111387627 [Olea europaea var. sylvestris]